MTLAPSTTDEDEWPEEEITLVAPLDEAEESSTLQQEIADAEVIEDEELRGVPRRGVPFEVLFFLTTLVVLLGIGVTAATCLIYFGPGMSGRQSSRARDAASEYVATSNADNQQSHHWLPANAGALRLGDTKVEVVRAE